MRHILMLSGFCAILVSCGQNTNKQYESELNQRELVLKKKELAFLHRDTINSNNHRADTAKFVTSIDSKIKHDLPFVGKKEFETMPGASGTGTPHRYVEIMRNGDVFFGFIQENQADGTVTKERYFAGKYRTYMKSYFKKWDNETVYYKFSNEKIYQVDKNNKILIGVECCGVSNQDLEAKCPCESKLY